MEKLMTQSVVKYSYNDISIKPAILSTIEHRAECNPYDENGMLPLFTAPMNSVVNKDNFEKFEKHGIIPILPRTEPLEDRIKYSINGKWAAFSMQEFEKTFTDKVTTSNNINALIDIANGHIAKLYELVRASKRVYGDSITIMVGNIANPETYRVCVESGVDFVRCSIGTGCGCITASNTGVSYPIASLISEIKTIKDELLEKGVPLNKLTKIVADGGIRNYSDIIKAIALGADYVMCGSIFAKMMESSALKTFSKRDNKKLKLPLKRYENLKYDKNCWFGDYTDEFMSYLKSNGINAKKEKHIIGEVFANFYGMASKAGQIAMNGEKTHTSEGIEKVLPVTYTMSTWSENFIDYIRSAMSYTNSRSINDLQNADIVLISKNTYESINK